MEQLAQATKEHICAAHLKEHKATQKAPFHFTDSGLPNVYLTGIRYYVCAICNRVAKIEIPAIEDLMIAIARAVVRKQSPLTGTEVKFLRKRLRLKATDFALVLSISDGQLSRFENDHNRMDGSIDKLVRLAYTFISGDSVLQKITKEFQRWSTSIHDTGTGENYIAVYHRNKQWIAEAEPIAA